MHSIARYIPLAEIKIYIQKIHCICSHFSLFINAFRLAKAKRRWKRGLNCLQMHFILYSLICVRNVYWSCACVSSHLACFDVFPRCILPYGDSLSMIDRRWWLEACRTRLAGTSVYYDLGTLDCCTEVGEQPQRSVDERKRRSLSYLPARLASSPSLPSQASPRLPVLSVLLYMAAGPLCTAVQAACTPVCCVLLHSVA